MATTTSSASAPDTGDGIVVGLSGGVDSAVAAALLVEAGHTVTGLFMKNWEEDDADGCSAAADLADARAVAERLGIELRTVNFATEYWDRVFAHFLREYEAGRTPNPDVLCNREIKFREFRDHAARLGAAGIATGHYARVEHTVDGPRLLRALDRDKDQTYFLHALDADALGNVHFPLAALTKREVRAAALARRLPVHGKRDSTGICFIGERPFRSFLARYLRTEPGAIVDPAGRVLGRHAGAALYTIGQRHGLGIGGTRGSDGEPWFVYAKDVTRNRVHVVQGRDHPLLHASVVAADGATWIAGQPPAQRFGATARCRHRQADAPCTVTVHDRHRVQVEFARPQRALAPGQAIVFYRGELCLGGAVMASAVPSAATDSAA